MVPRFLAEKGELRGPWNLIPMVHVALQLVLSDHLSGGLDVLLFRMLAHRMSVLEEGEGKFKWGLTGY